MARSFRRHLKKLMREYGQKMLTVEEIYKDAPQRQLKLVSECFDACVQVVVENEEDASILADMCLIEDLNDNTSTIKASDFYDEANINQATPDELKAIRQEMSEFLKEQCGIIIVEDGNIKSIKRFREKAEQAVGKSPHRVNDLNRVTILSSRVDLLDAFSQKLSDKNTSETFCAKDTWEYKDFGLLSKSNYLFIDGFPTEIHLNDPKQSLVSKTITHLIYETFRSNVKDIDDDITYNLLFQRLPSEVSKSIDKKIDQFNQADATKLMVFQLELEELVENYKAKTYREKNNALLGLHVKIHEDFYLSSGQDWKKLYETAKKEYEVMHEHINRPPQQRYGM